MPNHGLSVQQIEIIRRTLAPFAAHITRVGFFGSRASGKARDNSDIDLVLYGPIDQASVDRLTSLFEETSLPVKVDLVAYELAAYAPLKAHIDAVMTPLFDQSELTPKGE